MHFQSITLYFVLVHLRTGIVSLKENILDDIENTCRFYDGVKANGLSSITTAAGEVVYWSICKVNDTNINSNCPKDSIICLKNDGSMDTAVNLGKTFNFIFDGSSNSRYRLQAEHSDRCKQDKTRNYTTYVSFDTKLNKPYLQHENNDRCVFDIRIPDPTFEYPCTTKVDGFLLDFRKLTKDQTVKMAENGTFTFNLCEPAMACGDQNMASCLRGPSSRDAVAVPWGDMATRWITYENGVVQFQFHHGIKPNRRSTKVELHCKWDALEGPVSYLAPPASSLKLSKFVMESSLGCVKLPMNCKFIDLTNYEYDLSGLHRPRGNAWLIVNGQKKIRMNICGPLRDEVIVSECKDKQSQICGRILTGDDLSYGAVLVDKRVEGDTLKARLVHGSPCPKNPTIALSTNLSWRCSFEEKSPELVGVNNCSIEILWETPRACPVNIIRSTTLNIHDHLGNHDLTELCRNDNKHQLDDSSYIIYNLCTALESPCDGAINVSACLHVGERQTILGYYKTEIIRSENGILSSRYVGEGCGRLNISFICDYNALPTSEVSVDIIHSNCIYNMSISTPRVCAARLGHRRKGEDVCMTINNGLLYNLTGLSLTNRNHKYRDKENNIEYTINICNPIVTEPTALCKVDSAICMSNLSEPNFKHRFVRIGGYPGSLQIENGQLQLVYSNGDLCAKGTFATAKINFTCSENHEGAPILVKKNDCNYEFSWSTKYSCPTKVSNNFKRPSSCTVPVGSSSLNLTSVEDKLFQLLYEDQANFTFNICHDNYTVTYADGHKNTVRTLRKADRESLEFTLDIHCNSRLERSWNVVRILFECKASDEEVFELASIENCTAYMRCRSKMFCKEHFEPLTKKIGRLVEELLSPPVYDRIPSQTNTNNEANTKTIVIGSKIPEATSVLPLPQDAHEAKCTIRIGSKEIHLNNFVPMTMLSRMGNQYSIGLESDTKQRCGNYICKGNTTLATLKTCPSVLGDASNSDVQLIFNGTLVKNRPFVTTVVLKCNDSVRRSEVSSENDTSLTLSYPLEEVCLPPAPSNTGVIVGCTVVSLTLAFIILVGYHCCYHRRKYGLLGNVNKSEMYLYARDSQS